jgi:hypothetical protein
MCGSALLTPKREGQRPIFENVKRRYPTRRRRDSQPEVAPFPELDCQIIGSLMGFSSRGDSPQAVWEETVPFHAFLSGVSKINSAQVFHNDPGTSQYIVYGFSLSAVFA